MCAGLRLAEAAQNPAPETSASSETTVIGCLSGPDADDHYTLTSMQHRMGVDVVGGAKVKLTGSWEALPNAGGKKSDATQRFKATGVTLLEEKCQAPQGVTPVSKKKAQKQ